MHLQALSLLAVFTGIAFANGPWVITQYPDQQPAETQGEFQTVLDGLLFHAFYGTHYKYPDLVQLHEVVHAKFDHIYTTDPAEVEALTGPWKKKFNLCVKGKGNCNYWMEGFERIYVWKDEAPGRVPLHRFDTGKSHFYTLAKTRATLQGSSTRGWRRGFCQPRPKAQCRSIACVSLDRASYLVIGSALS